MGDEYKTISNKSIGEGFYSELKSKFLAFAHHVETIDEVKSVSSQYRNNYYDARHVCYAYMLGAERAVFRANDDGEPSSTGGKPILGQINANELTDILVIVVRYYGGVNLGTSRLATAYRTAAALAIENSVVEQRLVEETFSFKFAYEQTKDIMKVIKDFDARIVRQHYDIDCSMTLAVRKRDVGRLEAQIKKIL